MRSNEYLCDDLYVSAWLLCNGVRLLRTTLDGARVDMVHENVDGRAELLAQEFVLGQPLVNARVYAANLRQLKRTLYRVKDETDRSQAEQTAAETERLQTVKARAREEQSRYQVGGVRESERENGNLHDNGYGRSRLPA